MGERVLFATTERTDSLIFDPYSGEDWNASLSSGFSGFPFRVPNAVPWDGVTFFPNAWTDDFQQPFPSASSSEYIPVYGDGTGFPFGFTLEEAIRLYWRVRFAAVSLAFYIGDTLWELRITGTLGTRAVYPNDLQRILESELGLLGIGEFYGPFGNHAFIFNAASLEDPEEPGSYAWASDIEGASAELSWVDEISISDFEFALFQWPGDGYASQIPQSHWVHLLKGDDGLYYPGIYATRGENASLGVMIPDKDFSGIEASKGTLTLDGRTTPIYSVSAPDSAGGPRVDHEINVDTSGTRFWTYANSAGDPVWDETTGEQINDPLS